jgi:catechol 2,3-dioxygenase-like lactoylglutathione lyase family enzyme
MQRTSMALIALALGTAPATAQDVRRPRITGVAHMALYVHDVDRSLAFYRDLLGYEDAFRINRGGGELHLAFVKINDRQFLEIFPEKEAGTDRLNHIALEVEDAEAMRLYLASCGVKVPEKVPVGRIGNANYNIVDPDGHTVEIVQYLPDGRTARNRGQNLPETRIAPRMSHVGIAVGSLDKALAFYGGILGLQETWRGSSKGKELNWVNVRVPDGHDYVEFMLYKTPPTLSRLGTMHHVCLEVPDIEAARAAIEARPARQAYTRPLEIQTGVNRKRQLNLYDPDGTRIELMESRTVDGAPAPSSTAPPPVSQAPADAGKAGP